MATWIPTLAGAPSAPDVYSPIRFENGKWIVPESFRAGNKWSNANINQNWAKSFGGTYTAGGPTMGYLPGPAGVTRQWGAVGGNDPGTWTFSKDPTQYISNGTGATFVPGQGEDKFRSAVNSVGPALAVGLGGPMLGIGLNAVTAGTAFAPGALQAIGSTTAPGVAGAGSAAGAGGSGMGLGAGSGLTAAAPTSGYTVGGGVGSGLGLTGGSAGGTASGLGLSAGGAAGGAAAGAAGLTPAAFNTAANAGMFAGWSDAAKKAFGAVGDWGGGAASAAGNLLSGGAGGAVPGGAGGAGATGGSSTLGALAGGLLGGGISYLGAKGAADSNIEAAQIAAEASKFKPWNVYSGYGSGTMSGNTATAKLAPDYQNLRNQYLSIAGSTAGELDQYNPDAMAKQMYGKLQDVSAFQRQQDANAFENRLHQQGMMGLNQNGENPLMGAYQRAAQQANLQREIGAYGMSQDWADQMLARATGASNAATELDALPMQNLQAGGSFGANQASAAQFGANSVFNANQGKNAAYANLWGNLGNTVGQGVGQYLARADWGSSPFASKNTAPISQNQAGMLAQYYGYRP